MAYVVTQDNQMRAIKPAVAAKLWLILNGELKGTPEEMIKAKSVKKFLFNPSNPLTPASWKAAKARNSGLGGKDV